MKESIVGRILWRAVEDGAFRKRVLAGMGTALAEEGFIVSDDEMAILRGYWESLHNLGDRAAYERINALARGYHRG